MKNCQHGNPLRRARWICCVMYVVHSLGAFLAPDFVQWYFESNLNVLNTKPVENVFEHVDKCPITFMGLVANKLLNVGPASTPGTEPLSDC